MSKFTVEGGHKLKGEVSVGGSKNAALPILAATILAEGVCTLRNVPDISDVHTFLGILETLGAKTTFNDHTVTVDSSNVKPAHIEHSQVKKMRASILILGPLLGKFGEVQLAFPGGCVLGKRSIGAHIHALTELGAEILESEDDIHLRSKKLRGKTIIMTEASVTATENALMAAVTAEGDTEIHLAAMEPHVQDLCNFLVAMGAEISGIGTPNLKISGGRVLRGVEYAITPDYLEAGTFALAGVLTNSNILIKNMKPEHLDSFWQALREVGANFKIAEDTVEILPHNGLRALEKLQTAVFPGFPTDLQAPFALLLTQCNGTTKINETLFEGRLNYLMELERMGANVKILNPHQAVVTGPTTLKAAPIVSCDIRAGAALVLAALIAKGTTEISDILYIDRGYEKLDGKLRQLGAKIERIQE